MDSAIIAALMIVLPASGLTVEVLANQASPTPALVGKWFVIWKRGRSPGMQACTRCCSPAIRPWFFL